MTDQTNQCGDHGRMGGCVDRMKLDYDKLTIAQKTDTDNMFAALRSRIKISHFVAVIGAVFSFVLIMHEVSARNYEAIGLAVDRLEIRQIKDIEKNTTKIDANSKVYNEINVKLEGICVLLNQVQADIKVLKRPRPIL